MGSVVSVGKPLTVSPAVRHFGLPALREFLSRPENGTNCGGGLQNRLSLHILLNLMANVDDTNVLFRTDYASP